MARSTVDDCIKHCPNHFELVAGVVSRAKALRRGLPSEIPEEEDRPIVHALREIAQQVHTVDLEQEIRDEIFVVEQLGAGERPEEDADAADSDTATPGEPAND